MERDFAAGVYLSEAQNPIPPPITHCTFIRVYSILIHTGNQEKGRGAAEESTGHKAGLQIHD